MGGLLRGASAALPETRAGRRWRWRSRLRTRRRTGVAAALLAGFLLLLIVRFAGEMLVVRILVEPPDAILSLASHEWERLPATAELATQFPQSLVLLTLPARITDVSCHDCANRPERLVAAGVARDRIRVLVTTQQGTFGEALAASGYVRAMNLRRLLVVTSPYHTRRTLAVFRTVLADVPVAVGVFPASAHSPARPARWWHAPYDRWYVTYEWSALVYYALKYGIVPVATAGVLPSTAPQSR
jgi:uncharacterized SAM-binding protein YcdF (DUF218 family)